MKQLLLAGVFGVAFAAAIIAQPATAYASATSDVELCAAALDAQGVASAAEYRAKFVRSKGAVVKTVTVKLIPIVDGVSATEAECEIRRGEVVNAALKS
ncbi:MAG: hypothetical protein GC153_05105 [Alphaproteobacteria bacterium]|nr:hypothetical protein [Alphaproteobacteria bacterium]